MPSRTVTSSIRAIIIWMPCPWTPPASWSGTVRRNSPWSAMRTSIRSARSAQVIWIRPEPEWTTALAQASEAARTRSSASCAGSPAALARARTNTRTSCSERGWDGNVRTTTPPSGFVLIANDLDVVELLDRDQLEDPADEAARGHQDEVPAPLEPLGGADEHLDAGGIHEGQP